MTSPNVLCADARQLANLGFSPGSVDCIITSPPYWDLKRYGDEHKDEIGHAEGTYEDYVAAVGDVLEACLKLASPTGVLWLVADTVRDRKDGDRGRKQLPLPFDLARVAEERGWRLQETIVWKKNKTLPYSGAGKLRNLLEYVLFFTRSRTFKHYPHRLSERHRPDAEWLAGWPERYHPLGKRPSNLWDISIPTQGMWAHSERLHFCPFPQELVERCISLTTDKGDTVLDPFAGVGTVPAQAVAMGRVGLGVELNPTNVELFHERTTPRFQADWQAGAGMRRTKRQDQQTEAELILRLRLLKAGKEVMRLCERMAQGSPNGHPASAVDHVVVHDSDVSALIDIESGTVSRLNASVTLVASLSAEEKQQLASACEQAFKVAPFPGLSLDIDLAFRAPDAIESGSLAGEPLYEFGQARSGAFTAEPDADRFPILPKLLTTVRLEAPLRPRAQTPLELARDRGEREVLEQELRLGGTRQAMATRLGIHVAQFETLLVKHKLQPAPQAFAISLLPGI